MSSRHRPAVLCCINAGPCSQALLPPPVCSSHREHRRPSHPQTAIRPRRTTARQVSNTAYMDRKFESFERINSIRETNGNFDSCNSCKRLGTSRLHELHESKFQSRLQRFQSLDCQIAKVSMANVPCYFYLGPVSPKINRRL